MAGKLPDLNTYFKAKRSLEKQGDPIAMLKSMVAEAEHAVKHSPAPVEPS